MQAILFRLCLQSLILLEENFCFCAYVRKRSFYTLSFLRKVHVFTFLFALDAATSLVAVLLAAKTNLSQTAVFQSSKVVVNEKQH